MSQTATSPASSARRPRHRGFRWVLYGLGTVLVLLVIGICIVQIVLWSSTPKNLVMGTIEQLLGVRAAAETLDTDWFGFTTLHNVRFALPLASEPFVTVPTVKVHHRWLTSLAVTRDIGIRSIELDQPMLSIRQYPGGRWNLQDITDLLTHALGSVGDITSMPTISLPEIRIVGATVQITDDTGRSTTIAPVDFTGTGRSAVSWKFAVSVPGHVAIAGLLAPGGYWSHELDLQLHDVNPWLSPWWPRLPGDGQIQAHWSGQLTDGSPGQSPATGPGLAGMLMVTDASAAGIHLAGTIDSALSTTGITLTPRMVQVTTPHKLLRSAEVIGGTISVGTEDVNVQDLALKLMDGAAKCTGAYSLSLGTGQLTAEWDRLMLPDNISNGGKLTATLTRPFPGQLRIDSSLYSLGSARSGPWTAKCDFSAAGTDLAHFNWQVRATDFLWQRPEPVDLAGLRLTGSMRGSTLSLDSVSRTADPVLGGSGWYDFSAGAWAIGVAGQTWPLHPAEGIDLSFHIDAQGDRHIVRLHDFSLRHGADGELVTTGSYQYDIPKPVAVDLHIRNLPDPAHPTMLAGWLEGSAHLSGTLWPRQLDVVGQLHGNDLAIGNHHLGTVALKVSGTVDDDNADIQTERFALLGGEGNVEGIYSFAGDALDVGLTVHDVSLAQAGQVIGRQDCAGTAGGHWHLFLPGLSLDRNRVRLTGLLQANDARVGDLLSADQIDAQTNLQSGVLTVAPITMLNGSGHGGASLTVELANLGHMTTSLSLSQWPVELPRADGKLSVDLQAPDMVIDLPGLSSASVLRVAAPKITLQAAATISNQPAGHMQLIASAAGRSADLQQMQVSLLDGSMTGRGHLNLDQFSQSTASIRWTNLDTASVVHFMPALHGLSGRITGAFQLKPATGITALEPLALHLENSWNDGRYKTIRLKDLTMNGFANRTPEYSRIVLADDPAQQSIFHMATGTVRLWARVSADPSADPSHPFDSALAQVSFDDLDVDQLLHAVEPTIAGTPGKLSGNFMLLGTSPPPPVPASVAPFIDTAETNMNIFAPPPPTTAPARKTRKPAATPPTTRPAAHPALEALIDRFYGEAHATISDSNLANIGMFQALYNIMHFSFGGSAAKPTGYGDVTARLENGTLHVSSLRYLNRGTEIDALPSISNLADLPDSPLSGSAAGSVRPFSQIKLPLFPDVDRILSTLQKQIAGVQLGGTVNKPQFTPALLKDLGSEMQNLLIGGTHNDSSQ